ncbi:PAS domain S-box protein, partial [Gemmatimonadota bacterium]
MGTSEPDKLPDIQERDIFLERVRLLHREAHVAIFGAMVCIAAMVLFLSPVTELHLLIVWALAASGTLVFRFVLADRFRRSSVGPAEAPRWMNTFRIGLLVTGIVWGSAGILLYPLDSVPHQVFISFLLGGMATGSVATYSALRGLSTLFVLPAMLPIAAKFLLTGETVHTAMGIMVIVYGGILMAVSEGMYGTITTSLQLQFLNRELVSSLEESRNRAQALNAELIDEIASRTRTEKALRESEDRYRSIVDSALSGIVIIDDQYSITYANRESSEILGISVDRLVGSDFRNLLDEDTRRLVSDRYERRHRGEDPPPRYEIEFQRPGRESLQLELSAT